MFAAWVAISHRPAVAPNRLEFVQLTHFTDAAVAPALSPDGRMLAYLRGAAMFGGSAHPDTNLWVQLLPSGQATRLTNDDRAKLQPYFLGADVVGDIKASPAQAILRVNDPSTPFNFITNNDIIGGNSGSPVLNRQGELVGLAFDGNTESHLGRYTFNPGNNRCLCVDTRAILAALAKVYDAEALVQELHH